MLGRKEHNLIAPPSAARFSEFLTLESEETGVDVAYEDGGEIRAAKVSPHKVERVQGELGHYVISGSTIHPPGLFFKVDLDTLNPDGQRAAGTIEFTEPAQ